MGSGRRWALDADAGELRDRCAAVAIRLLRRHQDAEDVAQEAVARVLAARARGVAIRDERAYGLQIAARLSITRLRARANGRALEATGVDAGRAPATPIEAPPEVTRLYAAIRALPARQAAVVALRKLCELEYAEVAVLLGISQESCRSHCRRAIERLRAVLAKPEEPRGR